MKTVTSSYALIPRTRTMVEMMTTYGIRKLQAALLIGVLTLLGVKQSPAQAPGDAPKLADYFGFQPIEIYKLERRIGNLMIRDLDGDKIGDIIVANNARSRIDVLLSSKRRPKRPSLGPSAKKPMIWSSTSECGWQAFQ